MIFRETPLQGAYLIEPELLRDERGFFARTFCRDEFAKHGLNPDLVQCSISYNARKGTLRGMHYQASPHEETKIVRCTAGAIFDVIVDLRPHSSTLRQWFGVELTGGNRRMLYVPHGFAHGFQALVDDSEVFYQMSETFHPECARGFRWNDPAISIAWPLREAIVSQSDRSSPLL